MPERLRIQTREVAGEVRVVLTLTADGARHYSEVSVRQGDWSRALAGGGGGSAGTEVEVEVRNVGIPA